MRKVNIVTSRNGNTMTHAITKPGFALQQVNVATEETSPGGAMDVTIRKRNDRWLVHYTLTAETVSPTIIITDHCERSIRFTHNERSGLS